MTNSFAVGLLGVLAFSSMIGGLGCDGRSIIGEPLVLRSSGSGESGASPQVLDGDRDEQDPAVVAVVTSSGSLCTGTLIAPRYVLTARHCVGDGNRSLSVTWRARAFQGPRTPARVHLPTNASRSLRGDIAILELEEPSTVTPIPVNLDGRSAESISRIRMVGYGLSGTDNHDSGRRRSGTARAVVSPSYVESVRGTGGTCYGDSGGPALATIGGREHVVGVTSHGTDSRCEDGHSRFVRTDVHRAFLAQFVGTNGLGNGNGLGAGSGGGVADLNPAPPPTPPTTPTPPLPPVPPKIGSRGNGTPASGSNGSTVTIVSTKNGSIRITTSSNGSSAVVVAECACDIIKDSVGLLDALR